MNLAKFSLENYKFIYFVSLMLALSGVLSYQNIGWLEDPDVAVKAAVIMVDYPGATPEEVEREVVELIEIKLQEMREIKHLHSLSKDGRAIIKVVIKDKVLSPALPQVWNVLRQKIDDIRPMLPAGSYPPVIKDDFGSVFGFVLALTGDGFEQFEVQDYARDLRREFNLVENVARVDLWGLQQREILIELNPQGSTSYGVRHESIVRAFQDHNKIVSGGLLEAGERQYAINVTGELQSLADVGNVLITAVDDQGKTELVRLGDIADISYQYKETPSQIFRVNGIPAIAIAISPIEGGNIVTIGKELEAHYQYLENHLPLGLSLAKVAWQSDYVDESINSFIVNLIEAVVIVFCVISITMGLRMGLLIGGVGLGLTVLGSITIMFFIGLDLHRISLGALIVAMGMMVDNAIVVADGFVSRLQKGMSREEAVIEAAQQPSLPLLGATIVAVMSFYPVFGAKTSATEYASALFIVVGLSLMLSWIISQTIIPALCIKYIGKELGADKQTARINQGLDRYKSVIERLIQHRRLFSFSLVVLLGVALMLFPIVKKQFFPLAERNQFMVDYWGVEGSQLLAVADRLKPIEAVLGQQEKVRNVSSFIGQGPPRFYLPIDPELPNSSYAQLLVTVESAADVTQSIADFRQWLESHDTDALVRVRQFGVGSSSSWPIEIRVVGTAQADHDTLRSISKQVKQALDKHPQTEVVVDNWRQRVLRVSSQYNQQEGRWTGVMREDVARAIKTSVDTATIGLLRKGDEQQAISYRVKGSDENNKFLNGVQVKSSASSGNLPLQQIIKDVEWQWYDAEVWHFDQRRTITVQASLLYGDASTLIEAIAPTLEAIELPDGYQLEYAGEYLRNQDAQAALFAGLPIAMSVIVIIVVGVLKAYRASILVFAIIPFAIIGVVMSHLMTGIPIGFISLLGIFSLSGMMIKNSLVLIDEINVNKTRGMNDYDAVVESAKSRFLPVINASLTTVLGVIPLLQDVFWSSMAVTIMGGLFVGALITAVAVPVFFTMLYRIDKPAI